MGWAARKSSRVLQAQVNQERNYSLGVTWQASRGALDLGTVSHLDQPSHLAGLIQIDIFPALWPLTAASYREPYFITRIRKTEAAESI